jgi:hypothetical protein
MNNFPLLTAVERIKWTLVRLLLSYSQAGDYLSEPPTLLHGNISRLNSQVTRNRNCSSIYSFGTERTENNFPSLFIFVYRTVQKTPLLCCSFLTAVQRRLMSRCLFRGRCPWYMPNTIIRHDLLMPTVKEEICTYSSHYSHRLSAHPNGLILPLLEPPDLRRLQRFLPNDLPTRF